MMHIFAFPALFIIENAYVRGLSSHFRNKRNISCLAHSFIRFHCVLIGKANLEEYYFEPFILL